MTRLLTDVGTFDASMRSAVRFAYEHIVAILFISVGWFLAALPLVTLGVATLGAYTAVVTLRRDGHVAWDEVRERVRTHGRDATLLVPLPALFLLISFLYVSGAARNASPLAIGLSVVTFYVAIYLVLMLIPTFALMATGKTIAPALRAARSWVGSHPTLALATTSVTAILAIVTGALTIAFPLLFAGLACLIQVVVLEESELPGLAIDEM